jgi:hypothetical protein
MFSLDDNKLKLAGFLHVCWQRTSRDLTRSTPITPCPSLRASGCRGLSLSGCSRPGNLLRGEVPNLNNGRRMVRCQQRVKRYVPELRKHLLPVEQHGDCDDEDNHHDDRRLGRKGLREPAEKNESGRQLTIILPPPSLPLFARLESGAAHADEAKRRGRVVRMAMEARGCAVRLY